MRGSIVIEIEWRACGPLPVDLTPLWTAIASLLIVDDIRFKLRDKLEFYALYNRKRLIAATLFGSCLCGMSVYSQGNRPKVEDVKYCVIYWWNIFRGQEIQQILYFFNEYSYFCCCKNYIYLTLAYKYLILAGSRDFV